MRSKFAIVVLLVSLASSSVADAGWFRRGGGSSGSTAMVYVPSPESIEKLYFGNTASLQDIAQERADAMARLGRMTHSIHTITKVRSYSAVRCGEGIGCGTAKDPKQVGTCIVGRRVVADAFARAANGVVFRVRFFR